MPFLRPVWLAVRAIQFPVAFLTDEDVAIGFVGDPLAVVTTLLPWVSHFLCMLCGLLDLEKFPDLGLKIARIFDDPQFLFATKNTK